MLSEVAIKMLESAKKTGLIIFHTLELDILFPETEYEVRNY